MNEPMDHHMDDAATQPMGEASPFSGAAPDWMDDEEMPAAAPLGESSKAVYPVAPAGVKAPSLAKRNRA